MSGLFSLGVANALALAAAVGATALYARWLDVATFGHWAMALALARAGLVLLDGGLKTALVRSPHAADAATLRRLTRLCAAAALGLVITVATVLAGLQAAGSIDLGTALLLAVYPAAYWLAYPPLLPALARLERGQQFGRIGRAEGASTAIEFALPALLLAAGFAPLPAFVTGVVLARAVRTAWLLRGARADGWPAPVPDAAAPAASTVRPWLRAGLGVQAVSALSMVRDQSHLWLLAPAFGSAAAGQYALAITACAVASQVAVATASRVLLPRLRAVIGGDDANGSAASGWPLVSAQVRLLALWALPALALVPAWLAQLDAAWWGSKWPLAVALAPWLALRLVGGVATTVLGAWLMVVRTPAATAAVHARWTLAEAAAAAVALAIGGPVAMAAAMAFTVWLGVAWMLGAALPTGSPLLPHLRALAAAVWLRPSLAAAIGLAAWVHVQPHALPLATGLLPLVWLLEAPVRQWWRARLWRPAGQSA